MPSKGRENTRCLFLGAPASVVLEPDGDISEGMVWHQIPVLLTLPVSFTPAFPPQALPHPLLRLGGCSAATDQEAVVGIKLVRDSRTWTNKEGRLCGLSDTAEGTFITISQDQPNAGVESDLKVCFGDERMGKFRS